MFDICKKINLKLTMNKYVLVLIIPVAIFISCSQKRNEEPTKLSKMPKIVCCDFKKDSLPYLDSTIVLKNSNYFPNSMVLLTEKEAKKVLYKYFKNKGVLSHDELKGDLSEVEGTLCVDYDTLYKLNSNQFSVAIITYWFDVAYTSGHCFQPSRALITYTKKGYQISNENFIPEKFKIDSVGTNGSFYGYDFECANNKIIRHFKITLKL